MRFLGMVSMKIEDMKQDIQCFWSPLVVKLQPSATAIAETSLPLSEVPEIGRQKTSNLFINFPSL